MIASGLYRIKLIGTFLIIFGFAPLFAQQDALEEVQKEKQKCKFYLYWGWNRSAYSTSDINFKGSDHDFTLSNVKAKDRQTPFQWDVYFGPKQLSIPQYNFRLGYAWNEKYEFSIAVDHMKYVMVQDQKVTANGIIAVGSDRYDDNYINDTIELYQDFLKYEHTDGLNYLQVSFRRRDQLWTKKWLRLIWINGLEVGALMPKTNVRLINKPQNDEFHFAGYGMSVISGLKLEAGKHLFLQTEGKVGHIYMWDIDTSTESEDKASQAFAFAEWVFVLGYQF